MRILGVRLKLRSLAIRMMLAAVLVISAVAMTGCLNMSDSDFLDLLTGYLDKLADEGPEDAEEGETDGVELVLTYPVGASPKVFTTGWVFGARCVVQTEDGPVDLSNEVSWRGSGSFSPASGNQSRPSFAGAGGNEIVLSVTVDGRLVERTFAVDAVSPAGYAKVGDTAFCPNDSHGCPADPHPVTGPITVGSPNVFIDGRPAARVGDVGVHAACCGANTFRITGGDSSVLINGRAAARMGDTTQHCGGSGTIGGS